MAQQTAVEWLLEAIGYKQESDRTTIINIHPDCDITDLIKRAKQMEKDQLKQEFIQGYNLGYEDSQCNHINDGETLAQEREYLKESTCEYSGLRSVQSYEDPKK